MKELIISIFDYEIDQTVPNFSNNIQLATIFDFIKDDLDKNRTNYDRRCETSRLNGLFGGRPKNQNDDNQNLKEPKKPKNPNRYDMTDRYDMNDFEKENLSKEKDKDKKNKRKDIASKKNAYGTYKHVLLTDKELDSLKHEYQGHTNYIIQFLDDYIEEKGYTSKSHYLTIKRWVIDAYKSKLEKIVKIKQLDGENIPKWFNEKIESSSLSTEEERELDQLLSEFR